MPSLRFWGVLAVLAGLMTASPDPVRAQEGVPGAVKQERDTVSQRRRPDYDPVGIRIGSWDLFPQLDLTGQYDDNIFATSSNKKNDFIGLISPSVRLNSDWSNHALNFSSGATIGKYKTFSGENFEDFFFSGGGRVDVRRSTNVYGSAGYTRSHESRGDPDNVGGAEQTILSVVDPKAGVFHSFGRLSVRADGLYRMVDYDDVTAVGGGVINNDDRDRDEFRGIGTIAYEVSPRVNTFVRGSYNTVEYDSRLDDGGFIRDNDGFEVVAGAGLDITGLVFGNVFAGYISQSYDEPRFPTISGVGFGADVTWNVTPLTTLKALIERTVRQTTSTTGGAGILQSQFGGSVDHELLRNLILSASGTLTLDEFEGIDRDDGVYSVGASARYLINRYLRVSLGYNFQKRTSSGSAGGSGFSSNSFFVTVSGRL